MSLQKKPHATSPLLISLMVLNVAGIALLYIKSDLDRQQVLSEIGIVRSAGEVANVSQVEISGQGRNRAETRVSVTVGPDQNIPVTLSVGAVLRVVVDGEDEYLALISIESGKGMLLTRHGRASSVAELKSGILQDTDLLTLMGGNIDPEHGTVDVIISRKSTSE